MGENEAEMEKMLLLGTINQNGTLLAKCVSH